MTLFNPYMTRGRDTIYASTIHNNDISTRAQMNALNAAIASCKTFVFDRSYNITFARDADTSLFLIPLAGSNIYGDDRSLIDCSPFGQTATTDSHRKYLFSGVRSGADAASEGTPDALTADLPANIDQVYFDPTGYAVGDKIRFESDKTFIVGGTKMSFATVSSGLYDAVTVGQTITQGGASARVAGRYPLAGTGANFAGFILDTIVGTFTTSADVFQGANNLGTPTGVYNGVTLSTEKQGETATIYEVNADNVRFWPASRDSYAMANNATVRKVNMVGPTKIEGIHALGAGQLIDGIGDPIRGDRLFDLSLFDRPRLMHTEAHDFDNGSFCYSCLDGEATGNKWTTTINAAAATRDMISYGLGIVNASQGWKVSRNIGAGWKHFVAQTESGSYSGVTRDLRISENEISHTWNFAFPQHTNGDGIYISRNIMTNCSGGIEYGCKNVHSDHNEVRASQFIVGEIGTAYAMTEVGINVSSIGDKAFGGGFSWRFQDSVSPGLVAPDVGPTKVKIQDFYSEAANQAAVRIWWSGIGNRDDIQIINLQTRETGRPVDAAGNPTSGAATAAPSLSLKGTANGKLTGVKIFGADLRGWAGNAGAAILTEYTDGQATAIAYRNHAAPSFSGTGTMVTSDINPI